jgi:2-methylisocitrate lyase-like PEP mutase family enzyme
MTERIHGAIRLAQLLDSGGLVQAPGAHDALTARQVERAGFPAVYMTGFGATASRLGLPDLGLMTQTEMTAHARDMVRATSLPVIADGDTGYGGVNNLLRTVEEHVQAGTAAIHLEDQALPKRCGQLGGARLVSPQEHAKRVAAALAARGGSPLVVIARTDALGVQGMDAALDRAKRYADAGADLVFVDGVKTIAQAETIARGLSARKVLSIVDGTEAATLTARDIEGMGFNIVFYALSSLFVAAKAVADMLETLRRDGSTHACAARMTTYAEFSEIVDLGRWQAFEHQFAEPDAHKS